MADAADRAPTDHRAVAVTVTGTARGVGFRPFVARTAADAGLAGAVRHTEEGVRITFEGPPASVEAAVDRVRTDPPALATVREVTVRARDPTGREGFDVVESTADARPARHRPLSRLPARRPGPGLPLPRLLGDRLRGLQAAILGG